MMLMHALQLAQVIKRMATFAEAQKHQPILGLTHLQAAQMTTVRYVVVATALHHDTRKGRQADMHVAT